MGKYMRKSKATGGVALMEVSHPQASLGVRTRAKTLALRRLQKSPSSAEAPVDGEEGGDCYLQLRSRRLEKIPPITVEGKRQKNLQKDSNLQSKGQGPTDEKQQVGRGSSRMRVKSAEEKKEEEEKVSLDVEKMTEEEFLRGNEDEENKHGNQSGAADLGVEEASFGENVLEFEGRERTTRESTPCSLIRDSNSIRTPGSSTRATTASEASNRGENSMLRQIPTANEMDEFFTRAEEQQQKRFIEKYNFDPVNDKPLPGRYEWEKLKP